MSTIYIADLPVNRPLENPAVLRKEGSVGPRCYVKKQVSSDVSFLRVSYGGVETECQ